MLEKLIFNMIIGFTTSHIHNSQFGFLKGRLCLHKLLVFLSSIVDSLDKHHGTDALFLDICKALDTVDHNFLLSKLLSFGFSCSVVDWFKSYLGNLDHCVRVHGYTSSYLPVRSGVVQGSILGPILFLIYANDMFNYVAYIPH